MRRRVFCFAVLLAFVISRGALADGYEFFLIDKDGRKLSDGDVCLFPAAAKAGGSFLQDYFRSNDVRCLPAQEVLEFPAGRFHVFGIHPSGYISRVLVLNTSGTTPNSYRAVNLIVTPVAYLDLASVRAELSLRRYVGAVVYDRGGTYFMPQRPGEQQIAVPAGIEVAPLFVDAGIPLRAAPILSLTPGERHQLPPLSRWVSNALVVPVRISPDVYTLSLLEQVGDLPPPNVEAEFSGGGIGAPLVKLTSTAEALSSLLVFRVPKRGAVKLVSTGEFWEVTAATVDTAGDALTIRYEPLDLMPAGVLEVTWTSELCQAPVVFRLSRCNECASIASQTVSAEECRGVVRFSSVSIGTSVLRVDQGDRFVRLDVAARAGAVETVSVTIPKPRM